MEISRRALLSNVVAGSAVAAVAGCGTLTTAQVITIVQQNITDAVSIVTAITTQLGATIPATVSALVTDATNAINGLVPNSVVPPNSVSNILADLQSALAAALKALPGNVYLSDAQIVLSALQTAWSVVSTFTAVDPAALALARQHLASLKA